MKNPHFRYYWLHGYKNNVIVANVRTNKAVIHTESKDKTSSPITSDFSYKITSEEWDVFAEVRRGNGCGPKRISREIARFFIKTGELPIQFVKALQTNQSW